MRGDENAISLMNFSLENKNVHKNIACIVLHIFHERKFLTFCQELCIGIFNELFFCLSVNP